jgi:hypothetical protein
MKRRRKPPELLPGETYALGFRRVAEQLRLTRGAVQWSRIGRRLYAKLKRTEELIRALQRYCDAREEIEMGRIAAGRRETAWAQLQYELRMYNRAERRSFAMVVVRNRERKRSSEANFGPRKRERPAVASV